jgi:hypothetical protein
MKCEHDHKPQTTSCQAHHGNRAEAETYRTVAHTTHGYINPDATRPMNGSVVTRPQHEQEKRTCPCKRLPLCLSSFTAAEFGNSHALERYESSVAHRQDAGGGTPLHLAAQHGHVSATAMLLQRIPVNAGSSGATALHRASFSGAVSTMRLLVADPACALLQPDTSFGDYMMPLHKAASGGRYLAVQLLLDALAARNELQQALVAVDNMARTPLDVAREKQQHQDEEQKSVARWDIVAGGTADWGKCAQLLEQASENKTGYYDTSAPDNNLTRQSLPKHLEQGSDCLDCDDASGRCLTSSWEAAFRAALSDSVGSAIGSTSKPKVSQQFHQTQPMDAVIPQPKTDDAANDIALYPPIAGLNLQGATDKSSETSADSLGQKCTGCGTKAITLYKSSSDGQLVCKTCRRRKRLPALK